MSPRKRRGARAVGPFKRPGRWVVRFIDHDGTRTDRSFPTRREATRVRDEINAAAAVEGTAVGALIDRYLAHLAETGTQPQSIYQTRIALQRFLPDPDEECAGLVRLKMECRYKRLANDPSPRTGKPLAPATHQNTLAQARSFGAWLVDHRVVDENPWIGIKPIGKRARGKAQLSRRDARQWLAAALGVAVWGVDAVVYLGHLGVLSELQTRRNDGWSPARDRAVGALCALFLGLRASEIVHLRVRDLDDAWRPADTVSIVRSKTAAGVRELEVPDMLRHFFVAIAAGRRGDEWLFPSPRSKSGRHARGWPRAQVQWICGLAGVPRITAHALRGMAATFALRAGGVGEQVARYLGHERVSTTLQSYAAPGSGDDAARTRGLRVIRGDQP